jgi:putative ABC transport system permease protein
MRPPRIPRTLVRWLAGRDDRAVIVGDLDEEFARRRAAGPAGARWWYWTQALASIPAAVGMRWRRAALLVDLSGDARRAGRLLRREPGFAAAAIVTMALGAGITTGVVSVVEAILLRPLPYGNRDRIDVIQETDTVRAGADLSWWDFTDLSQRLGTYALVAGYSGGSRTLTGVGPAERLPALEITAGFFDVLGVAPALGRFFGPADAVRGAPAVVVLSDGAWRRRFGADPAVVGRAIVLSGQSHTIVGVLPRTFVFPPRADPEVWLPLRPSPAQESRHYLHFLNVIAARRPDVPARAAAEDLRSVAMAWNRSGDAWHRTTGLRSVAFRDDMVTNVRPALLVLLGAALLVLFAASASVSGLVLARASRHARELSVRAALGATRFRLIRQLMVEAGCLGAFGALLGVLLGAWGVAAFSAITPARFRLVLPYADHLTVSVRAAVLSVALTVASVILASVAPALRSARRSNAIGSGVRATAGRAETRLRRALVSAQIALAVVLLAGTALVGRSVLNLTRVSPGFDIQGLVAGRVSLPARYDGRRDAVAAATERLLEQVRAAPGIIGAEAINQVPLSGTGNTGDFRIVGRASTDSTNPLIRDVTPGYFALLGLPLFEGRTFLPSDTPAGRKVVAVNRALARHYFPDGGAIGQRIVFDFFDGRPEWTIVGVVGDASYGELDRPMSPVVYFPFAQDPEPAFSIVVRASQPEAAGGALRAAVAAVDPELPVYGLRSFEQAISESNAMILRALVMRLLAWFSLAALLLGGVGVYGALSESMTARTREIGVRMALGATRGGIARLVFTAGAMPALIGVAAGAALTAAASPALRSLLFGVTLLDIPSLAAVAGLLGAVTLVACAMPAWRAVRLPVTTALRTE